MIRSKADLKYYMECDRIAVLAQKQLKDYLLHDVWRFERTLRKLEYSVNCKKGISGRVMRTYYSWKHRRMRIKYGLNIPVNVFGPGLSIAHIGPIIVNVNVQVGRNCRLHNFVHIATQAHPYEPGYKDECPRIGDNVFIGPGAVIVGNIIIGSNNAIGANSYVARSFLEEGVTIAGIPAKIVHHEFKNRYLRATDIVDAQSSKPSPPP